VRSDLAEIVWMMNKHSGSIELEVELLRLGEMERRDVVCHPTVIDGVSRGVKVSRRLCRLLLGDQDP